MENDSRVTELSNQEKESLISLLFDREKVSNKHIKPLYIKAKMGGVIINKVLIDNGASVNIIPLSTLPLINKSKKDITLSGVSVTGFSGATENIEGIIPLKVKVETQTSLVGFFVTSGKTSYNALLGRDWLHTNYCIPSSLHQLLILWNGKKYEIVHADNKPFEINSAFIEARCYEDISPTKLEISWNGKTESDEECRLEVEELPCKLKVEELPIIEDFGKSPKLSEVVQE